MSKITGRFATKDNRHTVEVAIYNKDITLPNINIDTSHSVKFAGESPIVITQQQSDTFDHLFKTQCKISLLSKQWLGEYLYANNNLSIVVNVWVDNDCVFAGYVTPNTYNQNYSHEWENIDINCVDMLSTLKERRLTDNTDYSELLAQSQIRPFKWFIEQMELDTKTIVIPNLPDVNYGEAEMAWVETGFTRVVNDDGTITYYGIESEIMMLDETTGVNTGNERQGELKTVTWIASEDTKIIDGVPYYVEYAHINVASQDVNTGDWRATTDIADDVLPVPTGTVNRVDGWTRGALPQPFEYYEHYTTFTIYDNGMEVASSDGIGDQIPETPDTTTNGSYYEFRQGANDDVDIDEDTGYIYYKNYSWCVVNGVAQNTGDWVRGNKVKNISGKIVQNPSNNGLLPKLYINETAYDYEYNSETREFVYYVPFSVMQNMTTCYFWNNNQVCVPNVEELYFNNFDTSNVTQFGHFGGGQVPTFFGMCYDMTSLTTLDLSIINTSQMTTMSRMFCSCRSLTSLDVSNFDMLNVYQIAGMFDGCSSLTTLNLSNWNLLENNVSYDNLFNGCTSLSYITLDNVPQSTFNVITTALLDEGLTSVIIHRDSSTYAYDSNTNTWIIQ